MSSNAANGTNNTSMNDDNNDMLLESSSSSSSSTILSPEEIASQNASKLSLLSQHVFEYSCSNDITPNKDELKKNIMTEIERSHMAPYYEALCERFGWMIDHDLLKRLKKSNEDEIATLDKNIKDAKDNQGEVEVADAQLKRANYYNQIGDKTKALQLYSEIPEKPLSTGQKIDMNMVITRLGFFSNDMKLIQKKVTLAKTLNEAGGDWDRRNRLKVYEGLFNILQRNFTGASNLLLDSIATFTATEIIDYNQFIFLTVLVCILKLNRPDLQKKIINSPDVISVINDIPYLYDLLHSFYDCHYADYFRALTLIYPSICRNRFLATHASYYLREMRIAGYNQFLESYKSINLLSMAKSFGVSTTFLDNELARFIAVGRLNAKIDAVSGIVETTRPDTKNAQYHAIIKQGDVLLNKVQKLSRVISI